MNTQVSVETVGPDQAVKWLAKNWRYDHQRPLASDHVKFLTAEMKRGTFKQDTPIEFCRLDDGEWLTDGQHRLTAVVSSGQAQRFVVVRRVVDDEQSVALDYTRTDKGRRRSISDDYRALLLHEELGLTPTQLNKFGSAVALINNAFMSVNQQKFHTDDRLRMLREYNDAYGEFLEIGAGCSREIKVRIERSATLGVALITLRYSVLAYPEKVSEFWKGAIWDDGLRVGDARKAANRHLLDTGMIGGAQGIARKLATPAYSSRVLARCFNAWVLGRTLQKPPDVTGEVKEPINIKGSPFVS